MSVPMSDSIQATPTTRGGQLARLALFAFLVSINFEMINLIGDGESGLSISRVTALIYGLVLVATTPLFVPNEAKVFVRFLIVLQIIIVMVSVYNIMPGFARVIDISFTSCAIIFLLLLCHQRQDPRVVADGLLYFAMGAVVISVIGLLGYGIDYDADARITIFGDNPNVAGVRMAIATMVLIELALRRFRKSTSTSLLLAAMAIPPTLFMIETGSRVAALALVVGLMVLYGKYMMRRRGFLLGSILIGIVLMTGVPYLILSSDLIVIDRLERSYYEGDLAGRGDLWNLYLSRLQDFGELIIGSGYSGFDRLSTYAFGGFMSPHNVFLEILILGGALGLVVFVAMNLIAVFGAIRQLRYRDDVLPLMLLVPYFGSILSAQTLNVKIMWVVLSICFMPLAAWAPTLGNRSALRATRVARAA
jgi:O-antigen ligase